MVSCLLSFIRSFDGGAGVVVVIVQLGFHNIYIPFADVVLLREFIGWMHYGLSLCVVGVQVCSSRHPSVRSNPSGDD